MIPALLFIGSLLLMALALILTANMTENKTDHVTPVAALITLVAFASISLAAYSGERYAAERAARVEAIEKAPSAVFNEGKNEKK